MLKLISSVLFFGILKCVLYSGPFCDLFLLYYSTRLGEKDSKRYKNNSQWKDIPQWDLKNGRKRKLSFVLSDEDNTMTPSQK